MKLDSLDHLVLTVKNIEASIAFYMEVLGMKALTFGPGRKALAFCSQKINLHAQGCEFAPKALQPTPGSADLCFTSAVPLSDVLAHMASHGGTVIEGPIQRTGATGPILSVYLRDPDGNLIEIANRVSAT